MNKFFTDSLIKNRQGEIWEMVSLSDKNIYTGSATVANQLIAHLMTVIDSADVCVMVSWSVMPMIYGILYLIYEKTLTSECKKTT